MNSSDPTANAGPLTIVSAMVGYAGAKDRLQRCGSARSTRVYATMTGIMIPIRSACAAVALAIITAATPLGRSDAETNQVIEMPNGLKYTDTTTGDGATAAAGNKVSVHYTGWLFNNGAKGTKFDSSVDRGQPFVFTIGRGQVIGGWDQGVATMKVGDKVKLTIPPELGYGARGAAGAIPPNATLIFEVELLKIN